MSLEYEHFSGPLQNSGKQLFSNREHFARRRTCLALVGTGAECRLGFGLLLERDHVRHLLRVAISGFEIQGSGVKPSPRPLQGCDFRF